MKLPFGLVMLAGALALSASAAFAGDFSPNHGRTIELAGVHGVAYYTVSGDRYDVVATLASAEGTPVRVSAQLNDGQAMTLMVPTAFESAPATVDIRRTGTTILITSGASAIN